ncbi:MAG: alpha/beta hydrolase [Cyclobacteriaceae bacterium]|nr:alpha/beta hydrolase [Cyclobacteriaceae bacterium]
MREIYLLSGLGADKRVFDFIDLSEFSLNYLDWIEPKDKESIESYASRLLPQIKTTLPILIGVSFGGMIAVEISKLIETDKVILISSAKSKLDIPIYFRIAGNLGLNKLMPPQLLKITNGLTFWFFGTKTQGEKELLRRIIKGTDSRFLKWAVDKIVNWKNVTQIGNLTHIHGTSDKILPLKTSDFKMHNGGHLMILNRGDELSRLIKNILN